MSAVFVGANGLLGGTTSTTANETKFSMVANSMLTFSLTTEVQAQCPVPAGGTFSDLSVIVTTNGSTNAVTIDFRNNGASGNQTVSCTGSTTGTFTDSTHSDTVSASNSYCCRQLTGASTVSFLANAIGMSFTAASGTVLPQGSAPTSAPSIVRTIRYFALPGLLSVSTTEASRQTPVRAQTAANFFLYVATNNNNSTATATLRKNAAAGNSTVTVGSSTTGAFQDSTHSDSLSDADLIDMQIDATASGSGSMTITKTGYWATPGTFKNVLVGRVNGLTGTGSQYYVACVGNIAQSTTETNAQTPCRVATTWSNIQVSVTGVFGGTGATITSRINGSNGNQTISVGAAVTGLFSDSTHSDTLSVGDKINLSVLPLGGSGGGGIASVNSGLGPTSSTETGTGIMDFSGISFDASGAASVLSSGAIAFSGISFAGVGSDLHTATGVMSFAGISISASGFDLGAPGAGKRDFFTF